MKLSYVYKKVDNSMNLLADIDFLSYDRHVKVANQKKLNKAYSILSEIKDELIREYIKNKQNNTPV